MNSAKNSSRFWYKTKFFKNRREDGKKQKILASSTLIEQKPSLFSLHNYYVSESYMFI